LTRVWAGGDGFQVLQIQLQQLGFASEFLQCDIDSGNDATWKDVAFRYFSGSTYYLPVITWLPDAEAEQEGIAMQGGPPGSEEVVPHI
jgi:hypothetical protein